MADAQGREQEQSEESDGAVSAGPAGAGDRRERLGQEHAGPRMPVAGAEVKLARHASRITQSGGHHVISISRQSPAASRCRPCMRWTSRRLAARRARSRPPTSGSSTTSASCSRRCPRRGCAGYSPSRFSFNSAQGRCPECEGAGTIKLEMNFLPPAFVRCEVCGGTRFNRETLDIEYHGKNIAAVLELSVEEALEFFASLPRIKRPLQALRDTGLGYLKLGQTSPTLSGGEAQRVKLVSHLLAGLEGAAPARPPAEAEPVHPRRTDHRPAHGGRAAAGGGAAAAGGCRPFGDRHRAQPRPHRRGGLGH